MRKFVLWIILFVLFFLGGFSGYLYVKYFNENRKLSITEEGIPPGAENVQKIGDYWYTFTWNGNNILFHREINYWAGTAVESMTIIKDLDDGIPIKRRKGD